MVGSVLMELTGGSTSVSEPSHVVSLWKQHQDWNHQRLGKFLESSLWSAPGPEGSANVARHVLVFGRAAAARGQVWRARGGPAGGSAPPAATAKMSVCMRLLWKDGPTRALHSFDETKSNQRRRRLPRPNQTSGAAEQQNRTVCLAACKVRLKRAADLQLTLKYLDVCDV